jgi:Arc/MetJ-type ribon-helix-helix transcriptional regulator
MISIRLDDEAAAALRALERSGLSRSDAVRRALVAAASEQTRRDALVAEVERIAGSEADRREKAAISALLDEISEPW